MVRRVGSIRKGDSIGCWLHGVAVRVARRARQRAARRMAQERTLDDTVPVLQANADSGASELVGVVYQEIDRLPGKYREPVILCCLEQMTYEQAARHLGTSEPALRGRLYRGRQKLEARLRARGFSTTDALVLVGPKTVPVLHPALVDSTVLLAGRFSTVGGPVTGAVALSVLSLAQGVVHAMFWNSFKVATFSALVTAGVLGTAVLAQQGRSGSEAPAKQTPAKSADNAASLVSAQGSKPTEQELINQKNSRIRSWLSRKLDLDFPQGVSLNEFLKRISNTSKTPGRVSCQLVE
jgi:RNA polymerase sigma factor (sigma-70 family)